MNEHERKELDEFMQWLHEHPEALPEAMRILNIEP
jgi:hypothetical protein